MSKHQLRFIRLASGVRYLRMEDVIAFIRELGDTEETDVRRRLHAAADEIHKVASEISSIH